VDRDLVIADRGIGEHAQMFPRTASFISSTWPASTHVRHGEKVDRRKLARNDRLEFGARDIAT